MSSCAGWWAALLLLAFAACADDESGAPRAPLRESGSALPGSPAAPPRPDTESTPGMQPGALEQPSASPPGSEGSPVSGETPVAPVPSMETSPPAAPAPEATPPEATPPATTPPDMPAPDMVPPAVAGGPDPNFLIFLLIGQSNMEGAPASEAQDRTPDPRIKVLALRDCPQRNQVHNQWYTAVPSLHTCGITLGPGDYFARTLAAAMPNVTIGLVPNAIAGVDIDIFRKGVVSARRNEFSLPPDNQLDSAYPTLSERARLAQQAGVIRGILFHQGESDAATGALQQAWPGKVQELVQDLRTDLGLEAAQVPFLAGELLANGPPQNGCCGNAMNPRVASLPDLIPNAFVVSGAGLGVNADGLHYNLAGQRELGRRYGQVMLDALGL